jgi:hypothetical protein
MFKYTKFLESGKKTEQKFKEVLLKNNILTQDSTEYDDIKNHVDLSIIYKIDVKGLKKINRYDDDVNQYYHYAEILNVKGEKGWAYAPDVDYFVFETNDYWLIVEKENLQNLIKEKVIKEYNEKPTLYRLYRRNGRKDIITLIDTIDMIYISDFMIKK